MFMKTYKIQGKGWVLAYSSGEAAPVWLWVTAPIPVVFPAFHYEQLCLQQIGIPILFKAETCFIIDAPQI